MDNNQNFNTMSFGQPNNTVFSVNNENNNSINVTPQQVSENIVVQQPTQNNMAFDTVTFTQPLESVNIQSDVTLQNNQVTSGYINTQPVNNTVVNTTNETVTTQDTLTTEQPQVAETNTVQEPPKVQEPIVEDKLKIDTATLSNLLNNASKAAVDEQMLPLTTVVQLIFSEEGFIIKSTDNTNYLTLIDRTHRFTKNISLAVKIGLLKSLISKLNCDYIELVPEESSNIIDIYAGESVIKMPNEYDNSTGQAIVIEEPEEMKSTTTPVTFDYSYLKDMITKATTFGSSESVQYNLSGVYVSDYIVATDKINMFSVENTQQALSSTRFYMTQKLAKIIETLNIEGPTQISYKVDENGEVKALTISSDNIILVGPTDPTQNEFPVADIMNVINFPFTNTYKLDKDKLLNAMQVAELFMVSNTDKDSCDVDVDGTTKTMRITNFNKQTNLVIPVVGENIPNGKYKLNIKKVIAALKNIDSGEIDFFVSVNNPNLVKITDGTLNEILSVTSFE